MSTMTVSAFREDMLRLHAEHRSYEVLGRALHYLAHVPGDLEISLLAIQAYLELGLVPPAVELLDQLEPTGLTAELTELGKRLRGAGGEPIRWSRHDEVFRANLSGLQSPRLRAALLEARATLDREYELFRDRSGAPHVRRRRGDRVEWVPFLGDHRAHDTQRPLPPDHTRNQPGPYLVLEVGHGHYVRRLYEATQHTYHGYSCALFIVVPDPADLAVALHLGEWGAILRDPRVHWSVGADWQGALGTLLQGAPDLPLPCHLLSCTPNAPLDEARRVVESLSAERERATAESFAALTRRYAERGPGWVARRMEEALDGSGPPLRVLAAVSRHTTFLKHSMRDIQRAFEALGHRFEVLTEATDHEVLGPPTYHEAIRRTDADLFFLIDHLRCELRDIIPDNLPLLTWDQDKLPQVFTEQNVRGLPPRDFLVGWAKYDFLTLGGKADQYLNACIPTCPEQFGGEPLTEEEQRRYACDVSYVSHASQTPEEFHREERALYADARVRDFIDELYVVTPDVLRRTTTMEVDAPNLVLAEAARRCGWTLEDGPLRQRLIGWYLWRLGDRIFRHTALEWVARWAATTGRCFRLYGNGWDRHPTLKPFAAGPAQNGRELLCIHRASKVNLQLMPAGFIHQRALDGLASGGFFLTRLTPGDARGAHLRPLIERLDALGIRGNESLPTHDDPLLGRMLEAWMGPWYAAWRDPTRRLLDYVRSSAEFPQAHELFPDFPRVAFDSEEQFTERVEHFLAHHEERREVAGRMRAAVLERLTYKATVRRILRSYAEYLRSIPGGCVDPRRAGGDSPHAVLTVPAQT
jgi:hypothetical protein